MLSMLSLLATNAKWKPNGWWFKSTLRFHQRCSSCLVSKSVCRKCAADTTNPRVFRGFLRAPRDLHLDHGRSGAHGPPLLLVLPMSRRSISGGCRTGHRKYGVFSRGAPHACSGRPRGSLRSRPRTDAAPGRFGGDHQIRGAYRRGHRTRYRPARASRDPEGPAVGFTRPGRPGASHPVCANGWDRSPGGEEGDGGSARQERGPTRSYPGGQVRMCFTQTTWDNKGYAIRDPDSTTYTGAIETAEEFGKRIYLEALKRGWSRAKKKVVIGDGAVWIWTLVAEHFPDGIQIVDLYHARQHLWEVARQLYPQQAVQQKAWMKIHQKRLLDKGKIEKLVDALRAIPAGNPPYGREDSHRGRLLREKCRADALSQISPCGKPSCHCAKRDDPGHDPQFRLTRRG